MDSDVLMFAQTMTVLVLSTGGFVVIGLGARILWRWGSIKPPKAATHDDDGRLHRLETAVDTIAIEVERISEGQRFMVSLLAESLPARRPDHAAELATPEKTGRTITPH